MYKARTYTRQSLRSLTPDKINLIIFGSGAMVSKAQDFQVSLLGKKIKPGASAKDLGVVLDPSLTYNDHVDSVDSVQLMARLGQINRVKHPFYTSTLTIIIKALLVFSKLYYCCNVWSNTSEHNLSRIQAVQNFAARIVSNTRKYDHISPTLKDLLVSLSVPQGTPRCYIFLCIKPTQDKEPSISEHLNYGTH